MSDSWGILAVIAVILLVVALPLIQIWGVNTLFDLGIGYSTANYFAMMAVNSIFYSPSK